MNDNRYYYNNISVNIHKSELRAETNFTFPESLIIANVNLRNFLRDFLKESQEWTNWI